jgi:hypothetical protein
LFVWEEAWFGRSAAGGVRPPKKRRDSKSKSRTKMSEPVTKKQKTMPAKNDVVLFIDAKADDEEATAIIYDPEMEGANLHVVITNLVNNEAALGLTASLFADYEKNCGAGPTVTFYLGLPSGDGYEKSHEEMFAGYDATNTTITDLSELHPRAGYHIFVFAPYKVIEMDKVLSKVPDSEKESVRSVTENAAKKMEELVFGASRVHLGLGYNSTNVTLEELARMNDLRVMNNSSSTVYPGKKGGMFEPDDTEVWSKLNEKSPRFDHIAQFALRDSKKFCCRSIAKAAYGKDWPAHIEAIVDGIDTGETLKKAQELATAHPNDTYLHRSIGILKSGKFKVESSDGQHAALWLTPGLLQDVEVIQSVAFHPMSDEVPEGATIVERDGVKMVQVDTPWLDIVLPGAGPPGGKEQKKGTIRVKAKCPANLTPGQTRDAFLALLN